MVKRAQPALGDRTRPDGGGRAGRPREEPRRPTRAGNAPVADLAREAAERGMGNRATVATVDPPAKVSRFGRLGWLMSGETVWAVREVGPLAGFATRELASAAARMAGAEPAAVVKGRDNRWHAVETNVNIYGGLRAASDNSAVRELHGLPSVARVSEVAAEVAQLQSEGRAGEADARRRELAALALGTDRVRTSSGGVDRQAGVVNVVTNLGARGRHGPAGTLGDSFEPGRESAIELDVGVLANPRQAAEVLFHETEHKQDYLLADRWARQYVREGHRWQSTPPAEQAFTLWLARQVASRKLTPAQAELVRYVAFNQNALTEARAFVRTVITALSLGASELARSQFRAYGKGFRKGEYSAPPPGSEVVRELTLELRAAWREWSTPQREALTAAIQAARAEAPSLWICSVTFR